MIEQRLLSDSSAAPLSSHNSASDTQSEILVGHDPSPNFLKSPIAVSPCDKQMQLYDWIREASLRYKQDP
ncbi:hypothetical protein Ciccas_014127, partial [Cichlidogyrus casuarinus]